MNIDPSPFRVRETRLMRYTRLASTSCLLFAMVSLIALLPTSAAAQLTAQQAALIEQGFKVFNTQTFKGNGRTCTTCHLPGADFNISPADIPTLSAHQKKMLFAPNVKPGAAGSGSLENQTMVQNLGLFNINDGVGGAATEVGTGNTPAGPFRASMTIAGLAFTTSNLLPDFCSSSSPPVLVENGTDLVLFNCPDVLPFPSSPAAILLTDVYLDTEPPTFGNVSPGVDDGTRNIELGWAGDGAIVDPTVFGPSTTPQNQDCVDAVNLANADPTNLTNTLRTFSLAAVKTHLTQSLNRMPGVDFRCPTSDELDAMAAFQEYLGRRFELALVEGVPDDTDDGPSSTNTETNFVSGTQTDPSQPVITFNDPVAETGKDIFLDGNAQCNLCHFNAGANDATGLTHAPSVNDPSAPFPGRNFASKSLVEMMRCATVSGSPSTCNNGATASTTGLNTVVAPVVFPQDPGDKILKGPAGESVSGSDCNNGINNGGNNSCVSGTGLLVGSFNVQSLIEAARKKSFFHNGAFGTIEDAEAFYFSPTADNVKAFTSPRKNETGQQALATLATTYFNDPTQTQQVLGTMGFFLRSLSAVYAIADCERLVNDTMTLSAMKKPTDVQVLLCNGELNDVDRLIAGATVQPTFASNYLLVQEEARSLQPQLKHAAKHRNQQQLAGVLTTLKYMQQLLATISPALPD